MPILKSLGSAKTTRYQSLKTQSFPELQTEHRDDDEAEQANPSHTQYITRKTLSIFLASLLLSCCSIAFGVLIGFQISSLSPPQSLGKLKFAVHEIEKLYKPHHEFGGPPSRTSNAAWDQTFPPEGGFFHDEVLAPAGASLSVYHQLHCIDTIRHSYWTIYDAIDNHNTAFLITDLPNEYDSAHVSHCLDFLRRMLMCNADLTIEHLDSERLGLARFGGAHQCVNWDEVVDWTLQKQKIWLKNHGTSSPVS